MLEVDLPKRSGCDVLRELQGDDELKRVPVVVLQTAEECPDSFHDGGYDILEFMPKPLDAGRFVTMVKSLHYSLLTELIADSMA